VCVYRILQMHMGMRNSLLTRDKKDTGCTKCENEDDSRRHVHKGC